MATVSVSRTRWVWLVLLAASVPLVYTCAVADYRAIMTGDNNQFVFSALLGLAIGMFGLTAWRAST